MSKKKQRTSEFENAHWTEEGCDVHGKIVTRNRSNDPFSAINNDAPANRAILVYLIRSSEGSHVGFFWRTDRGTGLLEIVYSSL